MGEKYHGKSLAELRSLIEGGGSLPRGILEALEADPRRGAQNLAERIRARRRKERCETRRLRGLLRYERELEAEGFLRIAGVDEAGVAPLAGPVTAAAVILPRNYRLPGLDDSKKILKEEKREELARRIKSEALCWAAASAEVEEIDRLNIYRASLLAMQRAVGALSPAPEFVLVDARTIPNCPWPQRGIVHGDALSASIAAASILAKTTRDALMLEFDRLYPGYGLAAHKGYPTPEHCSRLEALGASPVHRRSFARVRAVLGAGPVQIGLFP